MKCPYCGYDGGFNAQEINLPVSFDLYAAVPIKAYAICCGGCDKFICLLPSDYTERLPK